MLKLIRVLIKFLLWLLLFIVLVVLAGVAYRFIAPTFGAKPSAVSLERMRNSSHYRDGKFFNREDTQLDTSEPGDSMDIAGYLFPPDDKNPNQSLPSVPFDQTGFGDGDFVWFGHSTLLFRTGGTNILVDPVFNRASPIPIGGKPFDMEAMPELADLPKIDVVLISHDHYDHLDHLAISELAADNTRFLVPLGIQSHLLRWGVPVKNIVELDWFEAYDISESTFTLTPSRHFSGRGITNRFSTLWGSWVVKSADTAVYFSGDSGYTKDFKAIGDEFGPFDIAFIENGAYNKQWAQIHMMPEQSVQAALDLNAQLFFPIHWGKFDLAQHRWAEPIERAVLAAKRKEIPVVAPLVGQVFRLESPPYEEWWKRL